MGNRPLALPCGFERTSVTSADPRGLRLPLPPKITSAIWSLRRLLSFCSPSTHLTASTTLLLPQPLGPTIPVILASKLNSVLSAKLLNPSSMIFSSRMAYLIVLIFKDTPSPHA